MEIFPTTNMYLVMDDDGQPVYHVNDGAGSDGVLWHAGDHWEAGAVLMAKPTGSSNSENMATLATLWPS